jgi:preprotein translocase subunit SecA
LRQVIGWRGLAQRDPLNEYKSEAFELFGELITHLREVTTGQLSRVEVAFEPNEPQLPPMQASHFEPLGMAEMAMQEISANGSAVLGEFPEQEFSASFAPSQAATAPRSAADPATWGKVGRNEPCPCGSGKKFKHCHGAVA